MSGDLYQSPLRYGVTLRRGFGGWSHASRTLGGADGVSSQARGGGTRSIVTLSWPSHPRNGMTYNVSGDPQGANRPWGIDLVPLLISAQEWQLIEAGVTQRAKLLNLLGRFIRPPGTAEARALSSAASLWESTIPLRPLVGVAIPDVATFIASGGPCTLAGRPMVDIGRSHTSAFRQRLCSRKSHDRIRSSS